MEIGSVGGWIAAGALAAFIIAPVIWYGLLRKKS